MIIIPKHLQNLVAGYEKICAFDRTLPGKWRQPLLFSYTQKRREYEETLSELPQRQRQVRYNITVMAGLLVALLFTCLFIGMVHLIFIRNGNLAITLLELSLSGFMAVLLIFLTYEFTQWSKKPQLPAHPLKSNLFAPSLPQWRKGLYGAVPIDTPTVGAPAENNFVAFLQFLDDSHLVTYRLWVHPKGEADVVVVGPKGIWLFEIKNWEGEIWYRDGEWERSDRIYYAPGGIEQRKPRPVPKPYPHDKWKWVREDMKRIILNAVPDLIFTVPNFANIQGGIVFANPANSTRNIVDCPVNCGTPQFWKQVLEQTTAIAGVNEQVCLQVMDSLLDRHRQVSGEKASLSMDAWAGSVEKQVETRLKAWADN